MGYLSAPLPNKGDTNMSLWNISDQDSLLGNHFSTQENKNIYIHSQQEDLFKECIKDYVAFLAKKTF